MRWTHLAACASVAALAACSDAPLTPAGPRDLYDLSQVTFLTPDQYAAHGIQEPVRPVGPSLVEQPLEPCYDNCPQPEPEPPPRAYLDYFTSNDVTNNGTVKTSTMWTYSQAHNNMESMVLRVSFQSVGAQGWKGCGATPAEFDNDYQVAFGSPRELRSSQAAQYPSSAAFVWRIKADHTFTAQYGYVVYGTSRSRTFYSANTTCW